MSYKIIYDPEQNNRYPNKIRIKSKAKILTAVILALMIIILALYPPVTKALEFFLLPGDPAQTKQAIAGLMVELKSDADIKSAVTAFCMEILDGARG